jgi:sarcosine oxidase subunit gamma
MSEPAILRHGLEPFLSSTPQQVSAESGVSIQIRTGFGHLNLRGSPLDSGFLAEVANVLGQELPRISNTMTIGEHRIFWLGLDEWQIVTSGEITDALATQLREALDERHVSITDLSGGYIAMRVGGPGARRVLAKGCTLDLHPGVFEVNACVQCGLAKSTVLLGLVDSEPVFDIVVRRSFADYLGRWLKHAAGEFAVEFTVD